MTNEQQSADQGRGVGDWRIDSSTPNPILVYQNCSVIQDEQASYVLGLIAKDAALTQPKGSASIPDISRWTMAKGSDGQRWSVYMDRDDRGEWCKWTEVQQKWCLSSLPRQSEVRREVVDYNYNGDPIYGATKPSHYAAPPGGENSDAGVFKGYGPCTCILTKYCDGYCQPIYEPAATVTAPQPAQADTTPAAHGVGDGMRHFGWVSIDNVRAKIAYTNLQHIADEWLKDNRLVVHETFIQAAAAPGGE